MARHLKRNRPADWPIWFEPKGYPHFDEPIRDPRSIQPFVESEAGIARHAFLPFIHFSKTVRKYKRDEGRFVKKDRPLSYAGHKDSQIFRRYSLLLTEKYEDALAASGLGKSVIAYRRFHPPKCNIHFANEAFRFIEQHAPCVAMAFDVKDFFESLNHKLLKSQWKAVMAVKELPPDHYSVFRAITQYSKVEPCMRD